MKRFAILFVALLASASLVTAQEPAAGDGAPGFEPVTWERLVNAADEPHNWLMYNGTLDSQRFSGLDQIDATNVANLELKWAYSIRQLDRTETTPLVVDGVMFITESPSNLTAVDAPTGRPYWRYEHPLPDDLRICCGRKQPRRGDSGRDALHEHARRAPRRHRRAQRERGLGRRGGRLPGRATARPPRPSSSGTAW